MSHTPNRVFWLFLLLVCIGCISTTFSEARQAANAVPQAKQPVAQQSGVLPGSTGGQYAANDVCQTCHQEVWDKHFADTPHSRC